MTLKESLTPVVCCIYIFKDFIYLFMRERERETEIQAEGEAGSMQGPQRETRSQVSRTRPWAKDRGYTAEPPGLPYLGLSFKLRL